MEAVTDKRQTLQKENLKEKILQEKKDAATNAIKYVKSGMVLGLGTGSTVFFLLLKIAELIKEGVLKNIKGIPTSKQTEKIATELNIPLTTLNENSVVDINIDGADEIDKNCNLIKGGGGALLREKIVAQASNNNIIIADSSKLSEHLCDNWSIPIEVIPFALKPAENFIKSFSANISLRKNKMDEPFVTDENNFILDCSFSNISNFGELENNLIHFAGIVQTGLFLNIADIIIIGNNEPLLSEKGKNLLL